MDTSSTLPIQNVPRIHYHVTPQNLTTMLQMVCGNLVVFWVGHLGLGLTQTGQPVCFSNTTPLLISGLIDLKFAHVSNQPNFVVNLKMKMNG
jgi:hypothetical protein